MTQKVIAVQTGKRTAVLAREWDSDPDTYTVFTKTLPLKAATQALKYHHDLTYAEFVKWLWSVGSDVLREPLPHC